MARDAQGPGPDDAITRGQHQNKRAHGGDLARLRQGKREERVDEATLAYIRRVLCSSPHDSAEAAGDSSIQDVAAEPLEELLPPLTSSNAIDVQLYALIAVILNNFVQTWYNRITPDQQFVGEIVQIVAHCTRGLEQRLRHIDLESLVLDELPELLVEHVHAVRISQTSRMKRLPPDNVRSRYIALRPHAALTPVPLNVDAMLEQQDNEVTWCMLLVNRLIPLLLPPEDVQNPCLDVLVSEIFSELIFRGGICGKAAEPWVIWDGFTKVLRPSVVKAAEGKPSTRLDEYGLLSSSKPSYLAVENQHKSSGRFDRVSRSFWFAMQCAMTAWLLLRASLLTLMQASSIPARTHRTFRRTNTLDGPQMAAHHSPTRAGGPSQTIEKRPIISMHIWGCVSQLLSIDRRMPWLSGFLSLLQWIALCGPGQLCHTNSRLDRLMSATIQERLDNPSSWLPSVLQAARSALFPDNALAPARIPPTSDELVEMKRGCAEAIVEAIPEPVRSVFFATRDRDLMREDMLAELDLLGDPFLNKHLIISAVELLAVRLFPELAV